MDIPIKKVKQIREMLKATQVVIYAVGDNSEMCVATHGRSEKDARIAAEIGNFIKKNVGFPDYLCHAQPLARKCSNCEFFTGDAQLLREGQPGECQLEPTVIPKWPADKCQHFEPK
jgi:hypothetical protein